MRQAGAAAGSAEPARIVRVIGRLNIGGPARQAIALSKHLETYGYRTTLVRGSEEPDEGSMDDLAAELGVEPVLVPAMRRNPSRRDLVALVSLIRILRRERPHIVHSHAAKGGALGRTAAIIAFPRRKNRPLLIHTYDGHSLTGYFSPRVSNVFRNIERVLARFTDHLVAVSGEIRDDLVELGVAPPSKFRIIPHGFDLSEFAATGSARDEARSALRHELGIPADAQVVTMIARLVPIKRVDRFLRVALLLRDLENIRFVIVGDGELRESLRSSPEAQTLGEQLIWTGFRRDMPEICFASDVIVQTSDNEGTPVSLIEAQAAGVPVVSTDVGGTRTVLGDAETGYVVPVDADEALASAVRSLLASSEDRSRMGEAGKARMALRFSLQRLTDDLDALYGRLGDSRGASRARARAGQGRVDSRVATRA